MLLSKLLESLQLTDIQPTSDGVFHITFDDSLSVACIENSRFVRFESLVAVMPSDDCTKFKLLTSLLRRSAQLTPARPEGLYIDKVGVRVLLQRNVIPMRGTIYELQEALQEFLCGLEAWRSFVTPSTEVKSFSNSSIGLMRMRP